MKTWKDVLVALLGISCVVAGHVWLFTRHDEFTDEQKLERRMVLAPCKLYPRGKDGLPCDPANKLMPIELDARQ